VAVQSVAQDLGPVDAERVCPMLYLGGVVIRHAKAEHRHTNNDTVYDKAGPRNRLTSALATIAAKATPRLQFLEWEWLERSEEYVCSGQSIDLHDMLSADGWDTYLRGMRALAVPFSSEAIRRMPMPAGTRDLLDIRGSHGHYPAGLCRCHPGLRAVVLDLPEAVQQAAPLLAAEQVVGLQSERD
jgi:hypothetical protein